MKYQFAITKTALYFTHVDEETLPQFPLQGCEVKNLDKITMQGKADAGLPVSSNDKRIVWGAKERARFT